MEPSSKPANEAESTSTDELIRQAREAVEEALAREADEEESAAKRYNYPPDDPHDPDDGLVLERGR
jgi:hypothetical protein